MSEKPCEADSLQDVVRCEWFTRCGPTRGRRTKLVTCGKLAQWKCGGKRREHYYCTDHRNEFINAVNDRESEIARWSRVAANGALNGQRRGR